MIKINLLAQILFTVISIAPCFAKADSFAWYQPVVGQGNTDIMATENTQDALYAAGRTDCAWPYCKGVLIKLTKEGEELWRKDIVTYSSTEVFDLTVEANHVYVTGRSEDYIPVNGVRNPPASFVKKYDLDGNLKWTFIDDTLNRESWGIDADINGVYTIGGTLPNGQAVISRIGFDGKQIWAKALEQGTYSGSNIIVDRGRLYSHTIDNRVFIHDIDGDYIHDFTVPVHASRSDMMALFDNHLYLSGFEFGRGDAVVKVNVNGTIEWKHYYFDPHGNAGGLAVDNTGLYLGGNVYGSDEEEFGTRITHYNLDGSINEIKTFPNLNLFPHSVIKDLDSIYIGGTDYSTNNAFVTRLSENDLIPPALTQLNDLDGNGHQELAVLEHNYGVSAVKATVKDSVNNNTINDITFTSSRTPMAFKTIPDTNANNSQELALLNLSDNSVEIRDSLTGEEINTLHFRAQLIPIDMSVLPDLNNNGIAELAVLARHPSKAWVEVEIRDVFTGAVIKSVPFNPQYTPNHLALTNDINNDGWPELGIISDTTNNNQPSKLEIRNLSGELVNNIWLGKNHNSDKSAYYLNPSNKPMLAVLQSHTLKHEMQVTHIALETGVITGTTGFNGQFVPADFSVLNDINGNMTPEFIVFGKHYLNGTVKAEIRDSKTGTLINNTWLWKEYIPYDMALLPNLITPEHQKLGFLVRRFGEKDLILHITGALN